MEKAFKTSNDKKIQNIRCTSKYSHKIAEIVDDRYVQIACNSCGSKETIDMEAYNKN